jgi:hypothetical protein
MKSNEDEVATKLLLVEVVARMRTWLDRAMHCIDQLNDEQVWYRPNASSNAIGNLVLHIAGNLRQWILGGIGGQKDVRDRPAEFSAAAGYGSRELREILKDAVEAACKTIEAMPPLRVREAKRIQDMDVTLAHAVVMAVSHLGLHVGQIQYIGKMLLSDAYVGSSEPPGKKPR